MRPRIAVAMALVGGIVLAGPPAALAVPCGQPDPAAKPASTQPVKATLTLNEKSSRTNLPFKRRQDHEEISLVFDATGCELPTNPDKPTLLVLPKQGSQQLPGDVLSVSSADTDGTEYLLRIDVDANKFKPGSYDGLVAVKAPYLATNRTPITVSRSEDDVMVPLGIGALAGLVALVWFALLHGASRNSLRTAGKSWWIPIVLGAVAAIGAGAIAVFLSYWDQDVWSVDDNLKAALVAGFTGATTGAMAGVLGAVWKAPPAEG